MSAWAKPGVKCVCVNLGPNVDGKLPNGLVLNGVYTIRSIDLRHPNGLVGVHLVERQSASSYGYWLDRFRPLITRSQEDDVALFRKLLLTEGADA
jgi:hypothetical protein